MNEKNRLLKWSLVIVPLVAAVFAIYPPSHKLKGGIDLIGGSSLLFEIDTSGLSDTTGLSTRVMEILKKRVDPQGNLNLVWRPIGNSRLEVQIPRPPKEALERRKAYEAAREELERFNVTRFELEEMLHAAPDQRPGERDQLVRGVGEREAILETLIAEFDTYRSEAGGVDADAEDAARQRYEDALEQALETNVPLGRLWDVLALGSGQEREKELGTIRDTHPSEAYRQAIDEVVIRYDAWAKHKGLLEGPADLKRRIRGAGVLEFRILAERDSTSLGMTAHSEAPLQQPIQNYVDRLQTKGPRPRAGDRYRWFEVDDVVKFSNADSMDDWLARQPTSRVILEKYAGKWYVLAHAEPRFGLTKDSAKVWKLVGAFAGTDSRTGRPAVNFELDQRGGNQFFKLTGDNIGRQLTIFLDGVGQSHATINSFIRTNGQISGDFTQDDVQDLVSTLQAGSLPARLRETPLMEVTIGPSLGEHNRKLGVQAAMWGGALVALFILLYYRKAGFVANLALAMNLLFVLAIMAAMEATFTLPGIAGLILTVGIAVDANVLIFERIREEREKGTNLRKSLRLGYERAFSTIVDANVTTLITCIILGYLGTEEVKGFARVLGFGVACSMFTALFVTRLVFTTAMDVGLLKSLPMFRLFRRPSVDWLGLRRFFWPISTVVVVSALGLFMYQSTNDREALYDIEFLGGTSIQLELKQGEVLDDEEVRQLVSSDGAGQPSAVSWLLDAAAALGSVTVARGEAPGTFNLSADSLTAEQLEALTRAELEPSVERGGFRRAGQVLTLVGRPDAKLDQSSIQATLSEAAESVRAAAANLANARIQTVRTAESESEAPNAFEVITVETNKELVRAALLAVMGRRLNVERAISFNVASEPTYAPEGYWPIEEEDRYLSDVFRKAGEDFAIVADYDIRPFKGGAVIVLDELNPPITLADFERRIREIRLQPEFSQYQWRTFKTIGLASAGTENDEELFTKLAYVVSDENMPYYDDPVNWEQLVARPELAVVSDALSTEKSLRKVIQFAPQVAAQAQQQAILAIVVALAAIVAYIWIRFGQMQFGLAAIVALVHDLSVTLGMVALAHFVFDSPIGRALGLMDFKIDLPMIAAFLTIIGYSLNDTIVVFDRIRENRGKLTKLTPNMINTSINQTLSRTVLTSLTTFMAVFVMYVFGGPGIHGFSFALMVGVVVGTYSSLGIAAPLLHRPMVLHMVVYVLLALGLFGGLAMVAADRQTLLLIGGGLIAAALIWAIRLETRASRRTMVLAPGRA